MGKGDPDIPFTPDRGRDCKELTFETILASVDEAVLADLQQGSILEVRRQIEQARPLAFCYFGPRQVGTVTGPQVVDLLECLKSGQHYEGRILSLNDGLVRVVVQPV